MTSRQLTVVDALKAGSEEFTTMRQLAMRFRGLFRGGSLEKLDEWLRTSCAERKNASANLHRRPRDAFASFGRALRRPIGLPPFIDRHLYTSGCGSIYRSRMSHLTVPHPCEHGREYGFVRYDLRDTRTGYLIYRADINGLDALPVVTDGKNQETIDAVHRDCRFERFVECRRVCV